MLNKWRYCSLKCNFIWEFLCFKAIKNLILNLTPALLAIRPVMRLNKVERGPYFLKSAPELSLLKAACHPTLIFSVYFFRCNQR